MKWLNQHKQIVGLKEELVKAHMKIQKLNEECDALADLIIERDRRIAIQDKRIKSWIKDGENSQ